MRTIQGSARRLVIVLVSPTLCRAMASLGRVWVRWRLKGWVGPATREGEGKRRSVESFVGRVHSGAYSISYSRAAFSIHSLFVAVTRRVCATREMRRRACNVQVRRASRALSHVLSLMTMINVHPHTHVACILRVHLGPLTSDLKRSVSLAD